MPNDFIKAKLSRKALDEFAERYSHDTETNTFQYRTADNIILQVSGFQILTGAGKYELRYLLGQTYPYHYMEGKTTTSFPVTDLRFDKDKNPWGSPNDATSLVMLATKSGIIHLEKGSNGIPVVKYIRDFSPKPVTHIED